MRIFLCELKRIFTLKICVVTLILAVALSILLNIVMRESVSLNGDYYASYNNFLSDIQEKYGDVFDETEQAEWFAQQEIELNKIADELIAKEPIFQKYPEYVRERITGGSFGTTSFYNFYGLDSKNISEEQDKEVGKLHTTISKNYDFVIQGYFYTELKERYTETDYAADNYTLNGDMESLSREEIPASIRERLEKFKTDFPYNTFNMENTGVTADYFSTVSVFIVIALMFLLVPYVVKDQTRKTRQVQYSSKIGRKLFRIQFLTVIVAAVITTLSIFLVFFIPYADFVEFGKFHNYHLGGIDGPFFMFNLTLTQYVLFLTLLTVLVAVSFACVLFFLGRYSGNIVSCSLKAIPTCFIFANLAVACTMSALFAGNMLLAFFHYRLNMEIISAVIAAAAGLIIGLAVLRGEKKREIQ
ncbi:MAG: hypothetical protein LBM93_15375 [Oscillospiraceae bacterium]|jgi:hypothetical protein|nr:hypothetical protein [Oscillospiraceae bacterium]